MKERFWIGSKEDTMVQWHDKQNVTLTVQVKKLVNDARRLLVALTDGHEIVRQGDAFGDSARDTETKADLFLGRFLQQGLAAMPCVGRVTVEGMPELIGTGGPLWACVDPLDGSLNYRMRCGAIGLPHAICVTIFDRVHSAVFDDVVVAVVADLRSNDMWWSCRFFDERTSFLNGRPITASSAAPLDLGSQIVIGEMYYPENRERLVRAFAGTRGWLRSCGSAAYEMALVASGTAVAFISDRQKNHELGAGYALAVGAKGIARDFDGNVLHTRPYHFNGQTPVVLSANQQIADQIAERLRRG